MTFGRKNNRRTKHENEATIKTEKFQEEAAFTQSKHKKGGGTQQQNPSTRTRKSTKLLLRPGQHDLGRLLVF